jgi:hypothetical protein
MITNVHQQWNFHGLHKQVGGRHGIFHFGFEVGEIFGIGTIANMIFRTFVPVIFLVMASFFLPAMQGDV